MSSKTPDSSSDTDQDSSADTDTDQDSSADTDPVADTSEASPLQIALPDGSESVSDAIVTHREMLREPQDNGLATAQDITHLSEALESLSGDIQETSQQHDQSQSRIAELEDLVETQQRQIDELQSMVTSLAEILGTDTEWQTFDDA